MTEFAREDSRNPIVRRAAYAAIAGSGGDQRKEAAAIHAWIRSQVRFVQDSSLVAGITADPDQAEVLIRPADLLTMPEPQGDCDDFSMLAAAMLRAVGIPSSYRTVAADRGNPNYSHVYVVALLPSGELPIDASHGPYAGWEAPATGKTRDWPMNMNMPRTLGDDYTPDPGFVSYGPAAPAPDGGVNWGAVSTIASKALDTTSTIMKARYAVPQLNNGQYIEKPGLILSQGLIPSTISGSMGGSSTWLLLGVALLAAFAFMNRKQD